MTKCSQVRCYLLKNSCSVTITILILQNAPGALHFYEEEVLSKTLSVVNSLINSTKVSGFTCKGS